MEVRVRPNAKGEGLEIAQRKLERLSWGDRARVASRSTRLREWKYGPINADA